MAESCESEIFLLSLVTFTLFGRHCATSRKVTGSIPDVVIGFFH